jgi:hypothetical protein
MVRRELRIGDRGRARNILGEDRRRTGLAAKPKFRLP